MAEGRGSFGYSGDKGTHTNKEIGNEIWAAIYKAGEASCEPFPYECDEDMNTIRRELEHRTGSAVPPENTDSFLRWLHFFLVKKGERNLKRPKGLTDIQIKGSTIALVSIIILIIALSVGVWYHLQPSKACQCDCQGPAACQCHCQCPAPNITVVEVDRALPSDDSLHVIPEDDILPQKVKDFPERFRSKVSDLRSKFSHQEMDVWSTIEEEFGEEEFSGTALVIINTPSDQATAEAFAEALSWLLQTEHFLLDPSQFSSVGKVHARLAVEDVLSAIGEKSNSVVIMNSAEHMPIYVLDSLEKFCSSLPVQRSIVLTAPGTTPAVTLPACGERTILHLQREPVLMPPVVKPTGDYITALKAIRAVFPSQTARLWNAAFAVLSEHRSETPPRKPAMLIIGAPPGAYRTADVLAGALAKIYSERPLMVDHHQFHRVDADRAKLHLDRTLDASFRGQTRSAVFSRLDRLPGPAAMILHSYCDFDTAQYKHVAYFMTVHCSDEVDPTAHPKLQEEVVLDHLKRSWRDLHEEHRGPLLSRIASMVVVVRPEENMEVVPS